MVPRFIKKSFFIVSLYTFFLGFSRVLFLILYWSSYQSFPILEILKAFLFGLRFDVSISLIFSIPLYLSFFLPQNRKFLPVKKNFQILGLIPFVLGFSILFGDIIYYRDAGRRLSYEIFRLGSDISSTIGMIRHYPRPLLGFLLISVLFIFAALRGFQFFEKNEKENFSWKRSTVWHLVCIGVLIVGIRGGLQSKPLRPSFAYLVGSPALAHLALNPIYTVFYALKKGDISVALTMPQERAVHVTQELVKGEGMEFSTPRYPLFQTPISKGNASSNQKNVVVLILEGWPAKYVGSFGGEKGITPFLDSLAKESVIVPDFFAISHRSTNGIAATVCSLPTFEDLQIMNTSLEQNNFECLGEILGKRGYSTLFFHGAKIGSFGLNAFARLAGFKKYFGKEDFDFEKEDVDPTWGLFDHVALHYLNKELSELKEPFGAVWFSLTTHSPFHLPDEKYRVTPPNVPDHELIDTLKYADEGLKNFFDKAKGEDYFKNTIFVLVADHTSGAYLKGTVERQRIPFLIYAPGFIPPKVLTGPGGQLDILPTILDLLQMKAPHHSFGRSLFDSSMPERFVFVDRGGYKGWFRGDTLLLSAAEGPTGAFNWKVDPYERTTIQGDIPEKVETYEEEVKAFVQTGKVLMRDNRLSPRN